MIFDTNIFIYADRGLLSAKQLILDTQNRAISAVTYMEYVPFCRNKQELAVFEKMLHALHFRIYDIDSSICYQARQMVKKYALSHSVEMGDALIAATAIIHNELLCTSNIKHFTPMTELNLEHFSPVE
jgi:predicted nucleic acid-binding protein